jgi:hypothetical protein
MVTRSSALRLLGNIGQGSLVAYWTGSAFESQGYLEYRHVIFLFDESRRLLAKEIASPAGAFVDASPMPLRGPGLGIGTASPAQAASGASDYIKSYS